MRYTRTTTLAAVGAALIATTALNATPALGAEPDLPGWSFQEEVDLSDASRWTLETGQASNTSSYDLPENVSFDEDGLTVRGEKETRSSAAYTSGDAKGLDIKIPNYSRVEAVGSVPFGPGLWPALMWLRPLDSAHGEIDLMEVFGDDARVAATIHNEYGPTHRSKQGSLRWAELPASNPTGTHTYVMEKTPQRIVISVDGAVMLDAGPEDVRAGFDWDAIFERPEASWYPRVTMQIGCPPANLGCGIGLPESSWAGAQMKLERLRIWEMASEQQRPGTLPPPPSDSEQTPAPGTTERGTFSLNAGQEVRHDYAGGQAVGSEAAVTFSVPRGLKSGALYDTLQILTSADGKNGYRATAMLQADGRIRLSLAQVVDGRTRLVRDSVLVSRASAGSGPSVRMRTAYADGVLKAKVWHESIPEPGWQLAAEVSAPSSESGGAYVLSYLSRNASATVNSTFSHLAAVPTR